jgi:hypothetical protein
MSKESFPDVSAKQLCASGELGRLRSNIDQAQHRAVAFVAHGKFIREQRNQGNLNYSLESTKDGVLSVANDLSRKITLGSEDRPRLFGENLTKTIKALKVLLRK